MAREPEAIAELRRALGARLATFRLAAELTQGQLAKVAICDRTTLVHIEKGRARADERFWQAVDAACDADGALVAGFLALEGAKAEHERREHDLHLATVRAKAAELRGGAGIQGGERGGGQQLAVPMLDGLRRALLGHQPEAGFPEPPSAAHLGASVGQAHRLYQRADYEAAARLLPLIVIRIEAASTGSEISTSSKAAAYLAVAKLATKVGDNSLGWIAADRSLRLASEAERHGLVGIAQYQVACALLGGGHLVDAEQTAACAVDQLASHAGPGQPSVEELRAAHGALLLLLAIMVARRGDAQSAKKYLRGATQIAERLGQDGNWLWTAFGPTNIAIHEVAVQVALGDSRAALQLGESIDTDRLPAVLRGRRAQVHLELGWASAAQGDDSLAVLHLLEAERVANQAVSRNAGARELLTTLLARERRSATPGLRALATRAGMFQ